MKTEVKPKKPMPQKIRSTMTMIEPFAGEFAKVPTPLELALNYCSHKCGYCFANLNQPDRQANVQAIQNSIRKMYSGESESITSALLREKRPVCLSNRVDPFATSNYQISTPIIELLTELEIPVYLQTKGGQGKAKDALEHIASNVIKKPSLWYITIAQDSDAKAKQIEPAAPSITKRLELIDYLQSIGQLTVF